MKNPEHNCAFGVKFDAEFQTCFTTRQLVAMAQSYNNYVAVRELAPRGSHDIRLIDIQPDKKYLLDQFRNILRNVCDGGDACIAAQKFAKNLQHIQETLRPYGPDKKNGWLSNQDIENIMAQYEAAHSDFKFIGAVPSNCDKYQQCQLYKLNFDKLLQARKHKIGIIFNTDRYGGRGKHWVALYIDLIGRGIYYCDSVGKNARPDMRNFIDSYILYCINKHGVIPKIRSNTKKYQRDKSECGIYSCAFIIQMIKGEKTFEELMKHPMDFRGINSCRTRYFINADFGTPHDGCDI